MTLTPKLIRLAMRLRRDAEACRNKQVMRVQPAELLALAKAVLGDPEEGNEAAE